MLFANPIFNVILGLLGIALTMLEVTLAFVRYLGPRKRSWRRVLRDVDKIAEGIGQPTPFDAILSWPDGGMIAADLLHLRHFSSIPAISIQVARHRTRTGVQVVVTDDSSVRCLSNDKRLLVIDDVIATGSTMSGVVNHLVETLGFRDDNILTAALGLPRKEPFFHAKLHSFRYRKVVKLPWGDVPRDRST